MVAMGFGIISAIYLISKTFFSNPPKEIIYSDLINKIEDGHVKQVVIVNDSANPNIINVRVLSTEGQIFICKME